MSGDPRNVCQHREWTTRKIDTNEDGNAVRNDVANFADDGDDELSAKAEAQIQEMYDIFAGHQPNHEGAEMTRGQTVLDNAMWTGNRIKKAEEEAHAAAVLAGNCNTMLDAIMKHLGIELPAEPK